jgi:phosphomannomutase
MEINPKIFKKYDLRGVYPGELNDEIAYEIGRGFANYAKSESIMVGYDARLSSPALKDSAIKGITDQGVNVVDIGLCSTSCFYFTLADSGLGAGIMVTASHAPKEFNGFKPMLKDSTPLTKEQVLDFKKITLETQQLPIADKKGAVTKKDPENGYVSAVRSSIKEKIKPFKVVMDPSNGTAGLYIEKVFAGTGLKIVPVFFEPDGNFPNHETNPKIPENRTKLVEKILAEKADLGFMFDGDADRLYILDRHGDVIDPSLVLALISEYEIKNSNKNKIVVEVRTSKIVRDWVEKAGGSLIISTCWTIPIKLKIKSDPQIAFGGETSGHYIFRELHETDDGVMGALIFLQAISAKEESIDNIIKDFKEKYFVLEETNFKIKDIGDDGGKLKTLEEKYAAEGGQILKIDGLSVVFPDWWFNLRSSEAEPVIRLNLEANSKELFEEKKAEVIRMIDKK